MSKGKERGEKPIYRAQSVEAVGRREGPLPSLSGGTDRITED